MVGCMTGLVASAAALASTILMTATAGAPSINDGNADNSGGGYVVPPEFADDGDGDTQQLATAGDDDAALTLTATTINNDAVPEAPLEIVSVEDNNADKKWRMDCCITRVCR